MPSDRATLETANLPVKVEVLFGRVEIQSRIRRDGLRFIGEGRSLHYDMDGNLIKDTGSPLKLGTD